MCKTGCCFWFHWVALSWGIIKTAVSLWWTDRLIGVAVITAVITPWQAEKPQSRCSLAAGHADWGTWEPAETQFGSVEQNVAEITTGGSQQQLSIDVMSSQKCMIVAAWLCVRGQEECIINTHKGASHLYYACRYFRCSTFVVVKLCIWGNIFF